MKRIRSASWIACAATVLAGAGCQSTPYKEQPYRTRALERDLSERVDIGMPAAEVVETLQGDGWSCRPVVNGEIMMEDLTPDFDYTRVEAIMCQRARKVPGGERVYQVRIGLRDGLVSSASGVVERFRPPSPTWGYR